MASLGHTWMIRIDSERYTTEKFYASQEISLMIAYINTVVAATTLHKKRLIFRDQFVNGNFCQQPDCQI